MFGYHGDYPRTVGGPRDLPVGGQYDCPVTAKSFTLCGQVGG